ncbi:MAG: sugar phosphate isomerase/epimerase family protein [Planctomycetaceae bacterium]
MSKWPIGVFTSIDAGLGVRLEVAEELEIPTVQIHAPHAGNRTEAAAKAFLEKCKAAGITVTAVFGGFEGESYADIPTTVKTVGLVPMETRAARVQEMKEISISPNSSVAIPSPCTSDLFPKIVVPMNIRISSPAPVICSIMSKPMGSNSTWRQDRKAPDHLLEFIADVDRDNLFINFDPANMILYGTGDPIDALKKVAKYVRSVHCKDGTWAADGQRGKAWGREVPFGTGDINAELYLQTLKEIGYDGPLTIEREIPEEPAQQKKDIGQAVATINELKAKIG